MPTAPSLEFFFGVLKYGIRVVLKPSGVESAKQSPRGSSVGLGGNILLYFSLLSLNIFKASALWANAFYKLKCPYVCLSVCSLLRYRLTVFLPPLPEVGCPIFLEIRNSWGKVMKRSVLRFEIFCLEVV